MEWEKVKLGILCTKVCSGGTPKSNRGDYYGGKIPWLNTKEINFNRIFSTENTITQSGLENSSAKWIDKNAVIVAMYGATAGKVAIAKIPLTTNQACCNLMIDPQKADYNYIYYYLCNKYIELSSLANGGAQQNLNAQIIKDFIIDLPKNEDQHKIANILSSLDAKIENNNKINANLEAQAAALFKSWFVDYEPFKDGEFVESELGMIPKGWKVGTLSDIAIINPSLKLNKGTEATYLDMKNMPTSGSFPSAWEKKRYNGGMKFTYGDTLMARITPCLENGKVAYANFLQENEVAFGSTEYIVLRPQNGILPEVFYFLCRYPDFIGYATKNMNGSSGRQRVSGETIGNYKIVIPPIDKIEPLIGYFKSVMDEVRNNGFENQRLSSLRDTLLPKLMSGEIEL